MESARGDATLDRAIRSAAKQSRRWRQDVPVTMYGFNVALCLTVLLGMDSASAAWWTVCRKKWLPVPQDGLPGEVVSLQEALEEAVLAVSPAVNASWVDPNVAALGHKALRTASRAARDKQTRDWVLSRNALHGAAPASASVLRLWNSFGEDSSAPGAVLPLEPATGNDGSQRSWCHCWRLRCAAQVSVLRTKEPLSLTSKREKVFHLG